MPAQKRYSIIVRERQADHEIELCQCENGAEAIADAARKKSLHLDGGLFARRKIKVAKYEHVYVRENYPY